VSEITLLYYTANLISEPFAQQVRDHLRTVSGKGLWIISISHKPIDFGENLVLQDAVPSFYNLYKQILMGVQQARTPFVACCEDDALYTAEHFSHRPPENKIAYNMNKWGLDRTRFYYRRRVNMSNCIAPTALLREVLERRYAKYPVAFPTDDRLRALLEPGKYEQFEDFPHVEVERFDTNIPIITFNHRDNIGGVRRIGNRDILQAELPYWGNAAELWQKFYL
jgi:hypothetical protein